MIVTYDCHTARKYKNNKKTSYVENIFNEFPIFEEIVVKQMKVYKNIPALIEKTGAIKRKGLKIGFIPTMGALHKGHLSLINCSQIDNPVTVVSIFVNPTQFNNPVDLQKYPRKLDNDIALLDTILNQNDLVFTPDEKTIYPKPDNRIFNFGTLDKTMEGKHRPGHFNGVAQAVSRLFSIIKPDKAYFGAKDFQQVAIIKNLIKQLNLPVEIISCPIIRESDGLALSSRNKLLSTEQRKAAAEISSVLFQALEYSTGHSVIETKNMVIRTVNSNPLLNVEYFEIVDPETFLPVSKWDEIPECRGCIAVIAGKVRLIDNIKLSVR